MDWGSAPFAAVRMALAAGAVLAVSGYAMASGRAGNAAGDLGSGGSASPQRAFMGRGMVVPASREDFFRRPRSVVRFTADGHGLVLGPALQFVSFGCGAAAVTAVPGYGYVFDRWSDGSTQNPRGLNSVTADTDLTARFRPALAVAPAGSFAALTPAGEPPSHLLWDLSGTYAATVTGMPLTLDLIHDTKGKLSGTATCTVAKGTPVTMPVRGSVKGAGGSVTLKGTLKGATADRAVSVSLAMALTLEPSGLRLVGPLTGSVKSGGATTPVRQDLTLPVPAHMDGTWALELDLDQNGRGIVGTAALVLTSGARSACTVKGTAGAGSTAVLRLSGAPADPAAKAVRIRATVTPLEGGWARLDALSLKAYGQRLAW